MGLSPFHLQRTFKEVTGISPRAYADQCRLTRLKTGLQEGQAVTPSLYAAGYGSSSRLYERTPGQLGMTPATYRAGGRGSTIHYSISDSRMGNLLVASTSLGVCSVQFGETADELRDSLRKEFRSAVLIEEEQDKSAAAIVASLEGHPLEKQLPVDVKATAFQRRVWEHLRSIPRGKTESYSQVAEAIGQPKAARAVARACATNRVAIAIPCHRVIRNSGELGGYRWGLNRKRDLLEAEAASTGRS
jgi:AraC family transcriptional regulator of adaptative response/methylated-DNA-[protein]-cysteine methyltransferase